MSASSDLAPTDAPLVYQEIISGQAVSFPQVARRLPSYRGGRPVNPSTIWRWAFSGVRTADGRRVRLEVARLSGRWLTSEGALSRFLAAQQCASEPGAAPRTHGQRQRASEMAAAELAKNGI